MPISAKNVAKTELKKLDGQKWVAQDSGKEWRGTKLGWEKAQVTASLAARSGHRHHGSNKRWEAVSALSDSFTSGGVSTKLLNSHSFQWTNIHSFESSANSALQVNSGWIHRCHRITQGRERENWRHPTPTNCVGWDERIYLLQSICCNQYQSIDVICWAGKWSSNGVFTLHAWTRRDLTNTTRQVSKNHPEGVGFTQYPKGKWWSPIGLIHGDQAKCARITLGGDELSAVHLSQAPCACPIERHALEISNLKVGELKHMSQLMANPSLPWLVSL